MRESAVERKLRERVKWHGGITVKLMASVAGTPDRLVLLPGGHSYLVELKTDVGQLRPAQIVWFQRSTAIGHPVVVLYGPAGVDKWISRLVDEGIIATS